MKKLLSVIKTVGYKTAKGATNSASAYYIYQPKEPKNLAKRLEKIGK